MSRLRHIRSSDSLLIWLVQWGKSAQFVKKIKSTKIDQHKLLKLSNQQVLAFLLFENWTLWRMKVFFTTSHFMATFYIESEWPLHFIGATSTFPPAYTSYSFEFFERGDPLFFMGDPYFSFVGGGPSFLLIACLIYIRIMFWDRGHPDFLYIITCLSFLREGGTYILYFFFLILFKTKNDFHFNVCVMLLTLNYN